ncbi:phosphate ABC transporter permease subunit PstC, partial [archaeon SCG-AAA382B04]
MTTNRVKERSIKYILLSIAIISTSIVFFIFAFLIKESLPAFQEIGLNLFSFKWHVQNGSFGLAPAILGTLLVTFVALIIVIPIGISSALFLSEIASPKTRNILKPLIELLSGIPSIVYGFIGIVIFVPYIGDKFNLLSGYTILTGGVVLGIMALPIVISISDDAIQSVPDEMKNASLALGATKWETMKNVTLPAAISGVSTSIILGAEDGVSGLDDVGVEIGRPI